MKRERVVLWSVVGWVVAIVLSVVLAKTTTPTGDGFTRGWNRIGVFFGWQMVAAVLALVAWIAGLRQFKDSAGWRWLSRVPILLELVFVGFLFVLVGYLSWFNKPQPGRINQPSKPVTAPAAPLAAPVDSPVPVTDSVSSETSANFEQEHAIEQFQGVLRTGFETSHFYMLDGSGPAWFDAIESASNELQKYLVEREGRGSGVMVVATFEGYREDGGGFGHLGAFNSRIVVTRIVSARAIGEDDFKLITSQQSR